jgi:hypothetical protein
MNFKQKNILPITTLLFSSMLLMPHATKAAEADFRIGKDQSIEVGNLRFPTMDSYLSSSYFRETGKRCATDAKNARLKVNSTPKQQKALSDCTASLTKIVDEYNPSVIMEIKVWFHVIISSTVDTSNVSDDAIKQQIVVLNEDFQALAGTAGENGNNSKIKFTLAGITRTTNDEWYTDSDTDEQAYKAALGKDQKKYLNVYTNDAQGNLGYAYFPFGGVAGTAQDGVVALSGSVGGRNNGFSVYDQGRTLVHEIGHYLGLHHTFNEGSTCGNSFTTGDLIVDTNAESESFDGGETCAATRSTCGTSDPVDNYMNYNKDLCMQKFTPQQVNRMICSTVNYRPDLASLGSVTNAAGKTIPIVNFLLDE